MLPFKITPAKGKVLLKKDKLEDKTASGIVLGKSDTGRCVTGTIMSGKRTGERVVFDPGISSHFDVEGEKIFIIFEYDIIGTV